MTTTYLNGFKLQ